MRLWFGDVAERFRSSLFLVPMVGVVVAIGLASVMTEIDDRLGEDADTLPLVLTSTVDSARTMLGTIAGATITFAGIAFSVSLLIIQQASSQYSPRVVHTLFRDPFNKRVMGLVVGTFTYCLVVLRSVRAGIGENGDPVVPDLSVALAVVLGIATILAIVGFISHSAHSMDVSRILENVQEESLTQICREWQVTERGGSTPDVPPAEPADPAHVVRFDRNGWVQQLDLDALRRCVPREATMWVEAFPGRYAIAGTPLCHLSVRPEDAESVDAVVRAAVSTGDTRTMQQDVSFGLRQLADVALKALSPGVNDPTTAQDAIFHSAAVLAELLRRDPPPRVIEEDGRRLVLLQAPDHAELVQLAFDETRRAAAAQPAVCVYLLEALELLDEGLELVDRDRGVALVEQARLVVAGADAEGLLPADLQRVRGAFEHRFGDV